MTPRPRRVAVGIALAVAAADVALLWPRPAAAQAPVAAGSWHVVRQQTPVGAIPSTPVTDDGSLPVQNGPAGVLAFSALRYEVAGATGGTLTLSYSGPAPAAPPTIDVCRVTSGWQTGADQSWDSRPAYDCTHHGVGSPGAGRMTWQLDPSLFDAGALDVALVPDPADPTPFVVAFAAPGPSSLTAEVGGAVPITVDTPPGAPAAAARAAASTPNVPAFSAPTDSAGSAPVVATGTATAGTPPGRPAAAERGPASRAEGAGALAALALILLLRSFVTGGPHGRAARSLLSLRRDCLGT